MRTLRSLILACAAAMCVAGCASDAPSRTQHDGAPIGASRKASDPTDPFVHIRVAGAEPGPFFAILLPGASGLKVFDDHQHYFRAATDLNRQGIDAIVIDYKPAWRASPDRRDGPTRDKIAWVIDRVISHARATGTIGPGSKGIIVAWSLGAEGLWPLLSDEAQMGSLGVLGAIAFYPSNEDAVPVRPTVPLMILTGESDDVTPVDDIRKWAKTAPSTTLRTYVGAQHGFDIASLVERRTMRLVPFIGPSATFEYSPTAAQDARERVNDFLLQSFGARH